MEPVKTIGRCAGCNRNTIIFNSDDIYVCEKCLKDPNRGKKWAKVMERCRKDDEFRQKVTEQFKDKQKKKLFDLIMGSASSEQYEDCQVILVDFKSS